ncbi:MAG: M23 family metallopeptidase [Deferribacteres bacterium]|nr:M23 family metallopeptidase [candidate division KSB1 bacterium]MCB9500362.1 M23 family metallopeptidase [Deferribacteres bacterium]
MKIIRYNPEQDSFTSYSLTRYKLIIFPIITIGALLVFSLGFSAFYFKYQESKQLRNLKKQTEYLWGLVDHLEQKNAAINKQIAQIQTQAARLSEFAELPILDAEKWEIGSGGLEATPGIDNYIIDKQLRTKLLESDHDLEKFSRQVSWLYAELKAVEDKFDNDKNLRVHFPSIKPVPTGIMTSGYGMRHDPFTGVRKHHNGLDFFARTGTNILAPADGVVELARVNYAQNQTFGKLIIINHGSGIKTRYGHLGEVFVKKGDRVKRRQVIGTIGNSGRSTGPHLHYEVLKNDKHKNPYYFFFD